MKRLDVHFAATYPIYIGTNLLANEQLVDYFKTIKQRMVIVTDSHLMKTLGQGLKNRLQTIQAHVDLLCIPAGETYKTRETKQQLEDHLFEKKLNRDICLIALGGGMVTDLVGFVAATYCRGIPVIYFPTTLLAMADASIGGKTGVDTPFGKNLIGAFYQPQAVFIDLNMLSSLPAREWRNGLVEMLKHGLIRDAQLFYQLQTQIELNQDMNVLADLIYQNCAIKKSIIEQDERDIGLRQILNFGHTIGHAIELIERFQVSHGEAVAIGMIVEAYLAALMGMLDMNVVNTIEHTLRQHKLPLQTTAFADPAVFIQTLHLDKKSSSNHVYFVLLRAIGHTHHVQNKHTFPVETALLDQALQWAHEKFLLCSDN